MLSAENPWNNVPLKDYEAHMEHSIVGQSVILNQLMASALTRYKPCSLAVLGVAGGNGLEHVDPVRTSYVYGVDINPFYLNECKNRYTSRIENLILINHDLNRKEVLPFRVDLIWAGLIFEYIELGNGLDQINACLHKGGSLLVILQKNNGVTSVSDSGIDSVKQVGAVFSLVDEETFEEKLTMLKYIRTKRTEYFLPNGKSLINLEYKKQ